MNRKIKIIEDNIFDEITDTPTVATILDNWYTDKKLILNGKKVYYRHRRRKIGNGGYIEFIIGSNGIV